MDFIELCQHYNSTAEKLKAQIKDSEGGVESFKIIQEIDSQIESLKTEIQKELIRWTEEHTRTEAKYYDAKVDLNTNEVTITSWYAGNQDKKWANKVIVSLTSIVKTTVQTDEGFLPPYPQRLQEYFIEIYNRIFNAAYSA